MDTPPDDAVPVLRGFRNLVGHHCSSSALRSVLAYDGIELSEAACFGLGAGIGFFFQPEPGRSPSRRFNGRAPDLEGTFYRLAGRPLPWAGEWRPELIRRALEAGRPVLAQTDIYPIPYYDGVHFLGHGIAVVGLDGDEVLVADIAAHELSRMRLRELHAAVAAEHPPLNRPFAYAPAPPLRAVDPSAMAPPALRQAAAYMLRPPSAGEGVSGVRALAADLPTWPELPDGAWCARFGYQAIEKRGTGGGNFRFLYADFLEEAEGWGVPTRRLAPACRELGRAWRDLGEALKELAFAEPADRPRAAARASRTALELADGEGALFEGIASAVT